MKKIILFLAMVTAFKAYGQSDTVYIQTSAICETCKKTLENDVSFVKGVKKVTLDLDNKVLTVIYNSSKSSPDKIREAVTKSGYDADSLKADPKAYNRLPDCCKNHELHGDH